MPPQLFMQLISYAREISSSVIIGVFTVQHYRTLFINSTGWVAILPPLAHLTRVLNLMGASFFRSESDQTHATQR